MLRNDYFHVFFLRPYFMYWYLVYKALEKRIFWAIVLRKWYSITTLLVYIDDTYKLPWVLICIWVEITSGKSAATTTARNPTMKGRAFSKNCSIWCLVTILSILQSNPRNIEKVIMDHFMWRLKKVFFRHAEKFYFVFFAK